MPDIEMLHQTPLLTTHPISATGGSPLTANSLAAMTSSLQAMSAASSMVALSATSMAAAAAEAQVQSYLLCTRIFMQLK